MKCMRIILCAYAVEECVLFGMGLFATVELYTMRMLDDIGIILLMILCSLFISIIVVPLESVVLSKVIKRHQMHLCDLNRFDAWLVRGLRACGGAFFVLWFIYCSLIEYIARIKLGYPHGSDEYMAWLRPGVFVIFPGYVATLVIIATLEKLNWDSGRW